MAHFHITPGNPSVNLPSARRGQFSFTVTNALGRAVRIQASVVPEGGTKAAWLSIDGEAERDLGATETQTFIVKVNVPPEVPPGEQRFRLLVASVAHPDDDYDTSPAVAFTIPAVTQAHAPFPWWIAIAAGAALVIIIGGFFLFRALGKPGLGDRCTPAKSCKGGLTCEGAPDGGQGTCLGNEGTACKAPGDCVTGECTNGKCATRPPGANCTADSNCPPNQKCTETRPGIKTCLLKGGQPCTANWMCASWCLAKGQCAPENGSCSADADCPSASFTCFQGFCKVTNGNPCQAHADCQSNNCQTTCQPCVLPPYTLCAGICEGNRCVLRRLILESPNIRQLMPAQPIQPRLHF